MRIAILGGGLTGLTAAYYLAQKNHSVHVFEKNAWVGGLAAGFQQPGWDWPLEYTYHHFFASDRAFIHLARETGFNDLSFYSPLTSSIYFNPGQGQESYLSYPLDTPFDLLRFPLISFPERVRAGIVLALLKYGPQFSLYDKKTVEELFIPAMGERTWDTLFGEMFRKKFGKYAEKILASFLWARVKARTKQLGYPEGGFQRFVDHVGDSCEKQGVQINLSAHVHKIEKKGPVFTVSVDASGQKEFDMVIATIPTPELLRVADGVFPQAYMKRLQRLKYLSAATLILETEKPLLKGVYWLNISTSRIPFMVLVQHTNMIDPTYYGGRHIAYIGNYYDEESVFHTMDHDAALSYMVPHLSQLIGEKEIKIHRSFWFRMAYAQPVYDEVFLHSKPEMETPVKNFFIANLDMTYPYDRGTNYAVEVGRAVGCQKSVVRNRLSVVRCGL